MKKNSIKTSIIGIIMALTVISLTFTCVVAAENNSSANANGWNDIKLSDVTIKVPTTTTGNIKDVNGAQAYIDDTNKVRIAVTTTNTDDNPYLVDDDVSETVDNYMIYSETIDGQTVYTAAVNVNNKNIFVYAQNKDQLLNILKSINGGNSMKCDSTDNAGANIHGTSLHIDTNDHNHNNNDHDHSDNDHD